MNLKYISSEIEKLDSKVFEQTGDRRDAFKSITSIGKKIALTSLPIALGSLFNKTYAGEPTDALGVLNFALTLEYIEASFYNAGVAANVIPSSDLAGIQKIQDHENKHVSFLTSAIQSAGGTPVSFNPEDLDFTAKGTFNDVFTNYNTFIAVAQAFEDTGVRAYKGQAGNLQGAANRPYLLAALNIHSVEARHAAHIRKIRQKLGADVKPWITGVKSGIPGSAAIPIYSGEDNTNQGGVTITGLTGSGVTISADAATESFDEILTHDEVIAIVTPFFK
jgi:hypothetical protein